MELIMSATMKPLAADNYKDPYYYLLVGVGWVSAVGALVGIWALTPWFPWK